MDDRDDDDGGASDESKALKQRLRKEREQKEQEIASFKGSQAAKSGEYNVQCHIIEVREIKGRGDDSFADPVVVVTCIEQKKTTHIIKKSLNAVFDQTFFFEFNLSPKELGRGKLNISVYDANVIKRNEIIGSYEFGLESVYYGNEHHELWKQWVALDDPTDNYEGIQGYLRTSIVVLGPGDEQYIHMDAGDEEDLAGGQLSILMAPKIKQDGKLLRVKVFSGDDIGPKDDDDVIQYCQLEFASTTLQTKELEGRLINWNQEVAIPVMEPIIGSNIKFAIMDHRTFEDAMVCTIDFNYDMIKDHVEKKEAHEEAVTPLFEPRWWNLYGAPWNQKNAAAQAMNKGFSRGSTYRGRVLVQLEVEDFESEHDENSPKKAKKPKKGVTTINGLGSRQLPETESYTIQVDLYEGSEIEGDDDMRVEVHCGSDFVCSEYSEVRKRECEWYEGLRRKIKDFSLDLPKDLTQCPDIIVYLCNKKGQRVSFWRSRFRRAFQKGWQVPPRWRKMKEDKSLDYFKPEELPGNVLFSIRCGLTRTKPQGVARVCRPFDGAILNLRGLQKELWEAKDEDEKASIKEAGGFSTKELLKSQIPEVGTLNVWIKKAENIPEADPKEHKVENTYIKVQVGSKSEKTEVAKKTRNPVWSAKQPFVFKDVQIFEDTLSLSLYDDEGIFSIDDKLATDTVELRDVFREKGQDIGEGPSYDKEYYRFPTSELSKDVKVLIRMKYDGDPSKRPKEGSSIFSKIIPIKQTTKAQKPLNYFGRPALEQYQLRALIYQARDLVAADNDGQSDPYVVVELKGQRRNTETIEKNLDPQWYEALSMNVSLPRPLSLAPEIEITVMDKDNRVLKDDFLGRLTIACRRARKRGNDPSNIEPQWYRLSDHEGDEVQGELLMCFQLLTIEQAQAAPLPNVIPKTRAMNLQVATLGLRNLRSKLTLSRPFIKIHISNQDSYKTSASNNPSAENPNYLQVLKIPLELPVDPLFAPSLRFEVKDQLFGGLYERSIGTVNIPLFHFMEEQMAESKEMRKLMKKRKKQRALRLQLEAQVKAHEEDVKRKETEKSAKRLKMAAEGTPEGEESEVEPGLEDEAADVLDEIVVEDSDDEEDEKKLEEEKEKEDFSNCDWFNLPGSALQHVAIGGVNRMMCLTGAKKRNANVWNGKKLDWRNISGELTHVDIGADGEMWGCSRSEEIFRRNRKKSKWVKQKGKAKYVSVGSKKHIVVVNKDGKLYEWMKKKWNQIGSQCLSVSIGADGSLWGVDKGFRLFKRDPDGTWVLEDVPGKFGDLQHVSVGSENRVLVVNTLGSAMVLGWDGEWQDIDNDKYDHHINIAQDGTIVKLVDGTPWIYKKLEEPDVAPQPPVHEAKHDLGTGAEEKQSDVVVGSESEKARPRLDREKTGEVQLFLTSLQIDESYAETFAERQISVDDISQLTNDEVKELIPDVLQRSKLLRHMSLRTLSAAQTPVATRRDGRPEEFFEAECIRDKRIVEGGRIEYFLKWKTYEESSNSWEPGENVSQELIELYEQGSTENNRDQERKHEAIPQMEEDDYDGGDDDDDDDEEEEKDEKQVARPADYVGDITNEEKQDDEEEEEEYMIGRDRVTTALEKDMEMNPFFEADIYTGQQNAAFLIGTKRRKIGQYKGLIKLSKKRVGRYSQQIQDLMKPAQVAVRVYILRGHKLMPQDFDGANDPYLIVQLGDEKVSTRKRYVKDTNDPEFFESFEFMAEIPGFSELKISVWDWDGIGDDLIGVSTLDIEDRWFSENWKQIEKKPVEMRPLFNAVSSNPQGMLEMFLEIIPSILAATTPMYNIKPPPPEPFELRVIVWTVEDAPIMDQLTDQNDLYVTGILDGVKGTQKTDTHFRAKDGKGNFNWRMKFPIMLPYPKTHPPRLRLQIWDKDFFSANDAICEANISLMGVFKEAFKKRDIVAVRQLVDDKLSTEFWITDMPRPNGEPPQGRIKISIQIVPGTHYNQLPAGFGRSDPNMNPTLPPPEGRFQLKNPFTMMKEIMGERLFNDIFGRIKKYILVAILLYFGGQMVLNKLIGFGFSAIWKGFLLVITGGGSLLFRLFKR